MNVKLQDALTALAPWDLVIENEGKSYPTRRPSIGLIAQLSQLPTLSSPDAVKVMSEMFEEPAPNLMKWDLESLAVAVAYYLAYFAEQAKKNSRSLAAEVSERMAAVAAKAAEAPETSSST